MSTQQCTPAENETLPQDCIICLGPPRFPTGRPDSCSHIFCFLCINDWVKRRSECPLCKRRTKFIFKGGANGTETKVIVKERTAAHYENEFVTAEELGIEVREEVDITVAYARCRVCHLSNNEDRLLLCDGIVGHEADGIEIRCNAAYHCYCLPERLSRIPDGDWYCPFCSDMLETQRDVYNRRYADRSQRSRRTGGDERGLRWRQARAADDAGPSTSRVLDGVSESDDSSFPEEDEESDEDALERLDATDPSLGHESRASEDVVLDESSAVEDDEDWVRIDDYVLAESADEGYNPAGRTEVRRTRKSIKKRRKRKMHKRNSKHSASGGSVAFQRKRKRKKQRRTKRVTAGQRRLASAIGINPWTGCTVQKSKRANQRRFPSDGIVRGSFGAPVLSLNRGDNDVIIDEDEGENTAKKATSGEKSEFLCDDLIGSIMFEQTKTLAPARYQKIGRDGKIEETGQMVEYRKKVHKKLSEFEPLVMKEMEASVFAAQVEGCPKTTGRKNRPSRWGTPTTSVSQNSSAVTAAIPLPTGPPIQISTPLESIPVPHPIMRPPVSPQVAPAVRPSALNTSPSTSFAMNAFASPFGMNGPSFSSQPPMGISQLGGPSLSQQQLLQLPSQIFPNLLLQPPPLTLGAVNNILAAGILGSSPLIPPISQSAPLLLGQMHLGSQSQDLPQQLTNFAPFPSVTSQQPRIVPTGVPPPPPLSSRCSDVGASICEPLAEKIRKLAEANGVRTFAEDEDSNAEKKKNAEEPKVNESGRKSASAEDEEASDMGTKVHKNGPMFEEARRMLSESLKKVFKRKQITKEEYKGIMKKGVIALSQRTRLDQKKVDDYASRYVECVVHRRKKKH